MVAASTRSEDAGAVYVFEWDGTNWNEVQILTASDGEAGDRFGRSMALDGGRLIVGAYGNDINTEGTAYVFEKVLGAWQQTAQLTGSDSAIDDRFGRGVNIHGDRIIVGADRHAATALGNRSGAVYVFDFDGTTWNESAKLIENDFGFFGLDSLFGTEISVFNNQIIVGAQDGFRFDRGSDLGLIRNGVAYVFELNEGNWDLQAQLTPPADFFDVLSFGIDVHIINNTAIVGADVDTNDGISSGSAFVYRKVAGVWQFDCSLAASNAEDDDEFGRTVLLSGTDAFVAARDSSFQGRKAALCIISRM